MSKEIKFDFKYRHEGKEVTKEVKISFTNRYVIREYNQLIEDMVTFRSMYEQYENKSSDMGSVLLDIKDKKISKEDGKTKINQLEAETKELQENLLKYNENGFFEKRVELCKEVLKTNNINNELFYTDDFWDRCIDPSVMNEFLSAVVYKDVEQKKKP